MQVNYLYIIITLILIWFLYTNTSNNISETSLDCHKFVLTEINTTY